jgi:hypothetical protein
LKTFALAFAAAFAISAPSAFAHHSTAIFDMTSDVQIKGTITRYEWANPHVYLWVEEVTDAGERITWEVEGGPPAILRRSGISKEQIAVGDDIVIQGKPGRVPEKRQVLMNSLVKDDSSLNFGQANAIAAIVSAQEVVPEAATSLQGTWATRLDMALVGAIVNPADSVRTEKGVQARVDIREGRIPDNPVCSPSVLPTIYLAPDIKQIELTDGFVRIANEWDGLVRSVDLRAATHEGIAASPQGHSIGHWEGETLVVDTAGFTANPRGNGYTLPSSAQKHLIERFRLNEAGTHLVYSFVLEDPDYLAAPLASGDLLWTYRPDLAYTPLPCDADNATRHLR